MGFATFITLWLVAFNHGSGAFYQISTIVTLTITLGRGAAGGILQWTKVTLARFLSFNAYHHVRWYFEIFAWYLVGVVVASYAVVYLAPTYLSLTFGAQACNFATEQACLRDYAAFFGGSTTDDGPSILETVYTVPVIVTVWCTYSLLKSTLYALQEFKFMVITSGVCFLMVFVPFLIIWLVTSLSSSILWAVIVMNVPMLAVTIPFLWRVCSRLRGFFQDEEEKEDSQARAPQLEP